MTITDNHDPVLEHLTILKRKAKQVGRILLGNPLTEAAGGRILECAEQVALSYSDPFCTKPITFYCKHRQCPICQWRRSQRTCAEVHQLFDHKPDLAEGKWLFLTLTVRNCEIWNLRETLDKMTMAFQRMTRRRFWQENILGAIRYTEVDVGNSAPDTAHPHFHCLLLVRPSMFAGKNYMSKDRWADAWASAMQVHYTPEVGVGRLQGSPEGIRAQVLIRAAYSTKVRTDEPNACWLITATQQLQGLQLIQTYGVLGMIGQRLTSEDFMEFTAARLRERTHHGVTFRWDGHSGSYYPV